MAQTAAAAGRLVIGNKRYSSWSLRGWLAVRLAGLEVEEMVLPLTGGGKWVEISIPADPIYQHLLLAAEAAFWDCGISAKLSATSIRRRARNMPGRMRVREASTMADPIPP